MDAPPEFWLWLEATQSGDVQRILRAPLSPVTWLALRLLCEKPALAWRQAENVSEMLLAVLMR